MLQVMAEAFAKGLVDKIMVEVLDIIERDTQDGKLWEQHVDEETGDVQSELVHGRPQAHECTHLNYSKAEEAELIAKIVRDLRDIQIGDSRYVLPPLLALEKQVKCAACNVDGTVHENPTNIIETRPVQGQGDTHQIIHTAILESPTEPPEAVRKEKECETVNEATNVTVGLLQQLIEQLENKKVSCSKNDADQPQRSISKERIVTWEEKEEKLIRTIESAGNALEATTEHLQKSESDGRFHEVEPERDELKSRSSQQLASTSRKIEKDTAMIIEEILQIDEAELRKTSGEASKKKKRGLGGRLRKFFRTAFGRRKN